ncbi:MAG: MaoC family dehydratase [Alphaproteobacteria bacterium]|jgi:3-hydroxybutyryl-CoA dehydratase
MDTLAPQNTGLFLEDLSVGQSARMTREITANDVATFASISGDMNPVHLDADYAATTPFERPIVHGILTASHISAVLGMKLPGPGAIYVSQDLRFKAPVPIGATVVTEVTVTAIDPARKRAVFSTVCSVGDKVVLEGEARLMVRSRAD